MGSKSEFRIRGPEESQAGNTIGFCDMVHPRIIPDTELSEGKNSHTLLQTRFALEVMKSFTLNLIEDIAELILRPR